MISCVRLENTRLEDFGLDCNLYGDKGICAAVGTRVNFMVV